MLKQITCIQFFFKLNSSPKNNYRFMFYKIKQTNSEKIKKNITEEVEELDSIKKKYSLANSNKKSYFFRPRQ